MSGLGPYSDPLVYVRPKVVDESTIRSTGTRHVLGVLERLWDPPGRKGDTVPGLGSVPVGLVQGTPVCRGVETPTGDLVL